MKLHSVLPSLLDLLDRRNIHCALLAEAIYEGGVAAQMQADPKKQGKEKKPDENLVSLVFPDA